MTQVPSTPMGGLGAQGRAKALRRSVDMAQDEPDLDELWKRPPPEECESLFPWKCPLPRGELSEHRLVTRILQETVSQVMVEFALVQQTYNGSTWVHVVEVDSCHDVDVHLHRYSRRTRERVGGPEHVRDISRLEDVQDGYNEAYVLLEHKWEENLERWRHG